MTKTFRDKSIFLFLAMYISTLCNLPFVHKAFAEEESSIVTPEVNNELDIPSIPSVTLQLQYLVNTREIPHLYPPQTSTLSLNELPGSIIDLGLEEQDFSIHSPLEIFHAGNETQTAIIVPQTNEQRIHLERLFRNLPSNLEDSSNVTLHSFSKIPEAVLSSSSTSILHKMQSYAVSNWDFATDCPSISPDDRDETLTALMKTVPDILLRSLVSQASRRVDSNQELANLTLTIIKPFLPSHINELSERQKLITYGTAIIGGTIVGTAYLANNEVDFNNEFSIPIRDSEVFSSINIQVEGENIGLDSKNPYLGLGTTFNFDSNVSISLSGGASYVSSNALTGKQNAAFNVSIPISNSILPQKISVGGSISRTHRGPSDRDLTIGGGYSGNITYSTSPSFLKRVSPELSDISTTISVTPIRASGSLLIDPDTGLPENYRVGSDAGFGINYRIIEGSQWTGNFNFTIRGGLNYDPTGSVSPFYIGGLNITVIPKTGE